MYKKLLIGVALSIVSLASLAAPGAVGSFSVNKSQVSTGSTVRLSWNKPSNFPGTVYYNVFVKKPGESSYYRFSSGSTNTSINRLINKAGTHHFKIKGCDGITGCGPESFLSVKAYDTPNAPSSFTSNTYSVEEGQNVQLSWSAPSNLSSGAKYNVEVSKPSDNGYFHRFMNKTSATSKSRLIGIEGVHKFRVQACNPVNVCGGFKNLSITATKPTPPPAQVPDLVVPWVNYDGSYTLQWDGVADASHYELRNISDDSLICSTQNGSCKTNPNESIARQYGHYLPDVPEGKYAYYLKACNAAGCTPESRPVFDHDSTVFDNSRDTTNVGEVNVPGTSGEILVSYTGVNASTGTDGGTVFVENGNDFTMFSRTNAHCVTTASNCNKAEVDFRTTEKALGRTFKWHFDFTVKHYDYETNPWIIIFQEWIRFSSQPPMKLELRRAGGKLLLKHMVQENVWEHDTTCAQQYLNQGSVCGFSHIFTESDTLEIVEGTTYSIDIIVTEGTEACSESSPDLANCSGTSIYVDGNLMSKMYHQTRSQYSGNLNAVLGLMDSPDTAVAQQFVDERRRYSALFGIYHSSGWNSTKTQYLPNYRDLQNGKYLSLSFDNVSKTTCPDRVGCELQN